MYFANEYGGDPSVSVLAYIHKNLEDNQEKVIAWRRHLHQHPELSFEEFETASFIADKLRSFGLEVKTAIGGNGVIGILKGQHEGPTIGLRADFDALPIQDAKDVPYRSTNAGVMHACGHDGHTAALLGTAKTLSDFTEEISGDIIFIFQHAEEKPPGGAISMIKALDIDKIDYFFAAHLASDIPLRKIAVGEGFKMAAVDKFEITVKGKGGHGARPHDSIDPIVVGSDIVNALQKIVSRGVDPLQSAVVTLGVFHAGNAFNVIPNEATLEGTVRTFDEDVRTFVKEKIYSLVKGITDGYGASFQIDYLHGYPALFNPSAETQVVTQLFTDLVGQENVVAFEPGMGAEDFAYFLREKPGNYFKVGSQTSDAYTQFPHHHPNFDIDERALYMIQKAFIGILAHYLKLDKQ